MSTIKRILLAEDDPRDVELTLAALGEHNLANEVFVVGDGEEALDFLHRRGGFSNRPGGNPAVMLLDLRMPKVDGIEVLRQLRSDHNLCSLPVIILTSSRQDRDVVESCRLGINAYVVKPVEFQEFMRAVKSLGLFWAVLNSPVPVRGAPPPARPPGVPA